MKKRKEVKCGWQPIEDAPNAGRHVLLGRFINGVLIEVATAVFIFHQGKPWGWQGNQPYGRMIKWPPTHWMDIPPLDRTAASAGPKRC
jgi:hypothetical protein